MKANCRLFLRKKYQLNSQRAAFPAVWTIVHEYNVTILLQYEICWLTSIGRRQESSAASRKREAETNTGLQRWSTKDLCERIWRLCVRVWIDWGSRPISTGGRNFYDRRKNARDSIECWAKSIACSPVRCRKYFRGVCEEYAIHLNAWCLSISPRSWRPMVNEAGWTYGVPMKKESVWSWSICRRKDLLCQRRCARVAEIRCVRFGRCEQEQEEAC